MHYNGKKNLKIPYSHFIHIQAFFILKVRNKYRKSDKFTKFWVLDTGNWMSDRLVLELDQ